MSDSTNDEIDRLKSLYHANYIGHDIRLIGEVDLGQRAVIGDRVIIGHPTRSEIIRSGRMDENSIPTKIGDDVVIRSDSVIYEGVHMESRAETGHSVVVREGSFIGEKAIIGNFTVVEFNTSIGKNSLLHNGVATAENSWIGENVWISPHVVMTGGRLMLGSSVRAGLIDRDLLDEDESHLIDGSYSVKIEDNVRIGANAVILSRVRIGEGAVIGAGAVVDRDVPPKVITAGNPARVLKRL